MPSGRAVTTEESAIKGCLENLQKQLLETRLLFTNCSTFKILSERFSSVKKLIRNCFGLLLSLFYKIVIANLEHQNSPTTH